MRSAIVIAAATALSLTACGQQKKSETETGTPNATKKPETVQTYSGAGKVTSISGNQVTIAHGPIEGIGWPAMSMGFKVPGDMAKGIEVGNEVSFSFQQEGGSYTLTSIVKR